MGSRSRACQPEDARKRLLHRYWCRHCLNGRDTIRHDWFPLPVRWYRFRGCPSGHGSAPSQRCRLQDGPACLPLLLRPCLRCHQRMHFAFHRASQDDHG
jgi:hypothetical protein